MDQTTLVNEQVEGGKKVLLKLREHGFDMLAACWTKRYDDVRPYLYVVSPSSKGKGARPSSTLVYDVLRELEPEWDQPFERVEATRVKIIDADELLARWLLGLYSHFPPNPLNPKANSHFKAVYVPESVYGEWAWIYPPNLFIAPQPSASS